MAQWKETLEPYVKVQEVVKTRTLTPTAGEDLIIGCVIVSDAGPSTPQLIQGQEEFIKTYSTYTSAQDLTEDYIESLDKLFNDGDETVASTMWQNAYRLAGSNNLLVCRATSGNNTVYAKGLNGDSSRYVLRDGEILKLMGKTIKLVLDTDSDAADHDKDGFSINVNGIGILGNRNTDDGVQYDYLCNTLPDLIEELNNTSKFFCTVFEYFTDDKATVKADVDMNSLSSKQAVKSVLLKEVYLAPNFLDTTDSRCANGIQYLIPCEPEWESTNPTQKVYKLNELTNYSDSVPEYYAINKYNTASDIKIRIRRFNHDAVISKDVTAPSTLEKGGSDSPYEVLKTVLDTFTSNGTKEPSSSILDRDFFEIAVQDPGVSTDSVVYYNVGNISGRGDVTVDDLNGYFEMIQVSLPDDLHDLGLNYYGYSKDDYTWTKLTDDEVSALSDESKATYTSVTTYDDLSAKTADGAKVHVTTGDEAGYYTCTSTGLENIWADLTIDTSDNHIISVTDTSLKNALDLIELDEVYTTEGLCDLGYTDLSFQKYMATKAINSNYFYPISTINSTNYMTIGNSITKLSSFNSMKLYASAPWDLDTETLGWKTYISPSVLYWEAVSRNRTNNQEFHGVFGQTGGVVDYQNPVCEFNKKTRQLLLSKRINTIIWNTQTSSWNLNDNYTKQTEDTIMSDEGNSRLMIRISKAVPTLLKPFIGEKITEKLCDDVYDTIDYYFKAVILPMGTSVDAYQIFCKYDENLAAQNKIKVVINVRYQRSLKYVNVVNNAYDVGMDISSEE